MASKEKGKVKKKKKPRKQTEEFSLKDVLAAGGDKDDYEMLKKIDDHFEVEVSKTDTGSNEIKKDEVMSFIQELGLDKVACDNEGTEDVDLNASVDKNSKKSETAIENKAQKQKNLKEKTSTSKAGSNTPEKDTGVAVDHKKQHSSVTESLLQQNWPLPHKKLLVQPGGKWYDQVPDDSQPQAPCPNTLAQKLRKEAANVWENDVNLYTQMKSKSKGADAEWMKTVVSSGTLGDKIAALTLQIQESPVHQVKTLDLLLAMTKKKGRRESVMATDTMKDLWLQDLLPENRKLRAFSKQPLESLPEFVKSEGNKEARQRRLVLWYYEDLLKPKYAEFVSSFERMLSDNLTEIRSKALGAVFDLLSQRPEQEHLLLKLLVNKVGDPDRKVASKAAHLLRCLVTKHPFMKMVVTKEVEYLLYRPNISVKAQYYAVCFLNQMILSRDDKELASKLISIYFSFFKGFVSKGEVETKMLSALLSGVNRAFPFVKADGNDESYNQQLNTLFRVVHISTFNTSVQALMLLLQVMDTRQSVSDRYYQALYSKLLDPNLRTSSKQAMFLNVLYKSLKIDTSLARVKAFVKRLLQICSSHHPSFICGSLYLISELIKIKPGIKSLIQQPEEEDEEEHFVDIPDDEDEPPPLHIPSDEEKESEKPEDDGAPINAPNKEIKKKGYDIRQRNPMYCGAENTCLWEITRLCQHYHPSVSYFANTIAKGDHIQYKGDPLQDFTLMRFLDRFVYKNPKSKPKEHGGSLMQPKTSSSRLKEEPANSKAFLSRKEEDIREDELFFYRYFKSKETDEEAKKKKDRKKEDNDDRDSSESDDIADENGNFEFDFARELTRSKKELRKKQQGRDEDEEGSDEDDESGEEDKEFDYNDMNMSDDEEEIEEFQKGTKRKFTDQDYEKALLDNISSDEFESDDDEPKSNKSRKKMKTSGAEATEDISSLFASADEFAHLLEASDTPGGGSQDVQRGKASEKQIKWEQRQQNRGRGQGRGRGRGKHRGGRGPNIENRKFKGRQDGNRGHSRGKGRGQWGRGRGGAKGVRR